MGPVRFRQRPVGLGIGVALALASLAGPARADLAPTPEQKFDTIRRDSLDAARALGGRTQQFRSFDVNPMRYRALLRWQDGEWVTRFDHGGVTFQYLDSRYLYTAFRGYAAGGAGTSRVERQFLKVNGLGSKWGIRSRNSQGQESNLTPIASGPLFVAHRGDLQVFFDGSEPAYPESWNIETARAGRFASERHYGVSGPLWHADYTYGKVDVFSVPPRRSMVSHFRLRHLGYEDIRWSPAEATDTLRALIRASGRGFVGLTDAEWRAAGRQVDVVGAGIKPRVALNRPHNHRGYVVTLVWRNRPGSVSAVLHLRTTRQNLTQTGHESRVRKAR